MKTPNFAMKTPAKVHKPTSSQSKIPKTSKIR